MPHRLLARVPGAAAVTTRARPCVGGKSSPSRLLRRRRARLRRRGVAERLHANVLLAHEPGGERRRARVVGEEAALPRSDVKEDVRALARRDARRAREVGRGRAPEPELELAVVLPLARVELLRRVRLERGDRAGGEGIVRRRGDKERVGRARPARRGARDGPGARRAASRRRCRRASRAGTWRGATS